MSFMAVPLCFRARVGRSRKRSSSTSSVFCSSPPRSGTIRVTMASTAPVKGTSSSTCTSRNRLFTAATEKGFITAVRKEKCKPASSP